MFREIISRLVDDLDHLLSYPTKRLDLTRADLASFFDIKEVVAKENVIRRLFLILTLAGSMVYVPGLFSERVAQSYAFELYGQMAICCAFFAVLLYVGLNTFFVSAAGILAVSFIWLTNRLGGYENAVLLIALLLFYSLAKLRQRLSRS